MQAISNFFSKFFSFFSGDSYWDLQRRKEEAYLAKSSDIYELEARMRQLDDLKRKGLWF